MNKLKVGDKVAIVSLSSGILGEPFIKHELDLGVKRLKEFGLVPVFMDNALTGLDFVKTHPEERAKDLKKAFLDPEINAIISAIGGVDGYKVLPFLFEDAEFSKIVKENPKIFIGYSDTTTIHLALNKLGLNTFYGPAFITDFAEFENEMLPYTKKSLNYLFEAPTTYEIKSSEFWYDERTDFSPSAVGTNRTKHPEVRGFDLIKGSGVVSGKLIGGCIDVFANLLGIDDTNTELEQIRKKFPVVPNSEELRGKILFLETSDEKISPEKFKAVIQLLKNNGLFENISALLFGKPMDETYYEEYRNILLEEFSNFNFPILANMNFGHSFPRMVLPYGAIAELDAEKKTLTLKNSTIE